MIPGFTSTGSKNPEKLFGKNMDVPTRMTRAAGCQVWDVEGREYTDMIMALGAVSLGYGHPAVTEAASKAVKDGAIGSLAPELEPAVAESLLDVTGFGEAVRFFKTGAEGILAAIRIARVVTGRDSIVTCGYHGWPDQVSSAPGVPTVVRSLRHEVPFNDLLALRSVVEDSSPAALVIEPVVDEIPTQEWIAAIHDVAKKIGALVVLDEIKTGLRLGVTGARGRYGFEPDMVVFGKAIGNGFPLAAVVGPRDVMDAVKRTWISSTLATEFVSLAACNAVLQVYRSEDVARHLAGMGQQLWDSLSRIAAEYPGVIKGVRGIPEFCYLAFEDEVVSTNFSSRMAKEGILFKRDAYNFVALSHDADTIQRVTQCAAQVVGGLAETK